MPATAAGLASVRPSRHLGAMYRVSAFYHFAPLADLPARQADLEGLAKAQGVCGSILLAPEGVNGTIAGPDAGVQAVLEALRALPGFAGLGWKDSTAPTRPFGRMRVRLKREIVTLGQPDVDPGARVGTYVAPEAWNELISAPDVVTIDTRNDYEVAIGSFAGAIDPQTASFGDFSAWWQANRDRFANQRIAMFCTGGIRCEKASNWLLGQGVAEVFHLQGGILRYLDVVPEAQSLWRGACFVFDERVSLEHGLRPGGHVLCRACRRPVDAAGQADPRYEVGVSCPACDAGLGPARRAALRERQRQIDLAQARGTRHLGARAVQG